MRETILDTPDLCYGSEGFLNISILSNLFSVESNALLTPTNGPSKIEAPALLPGISSSSLSESLPSERPFSS